ncbi:MAG TPA: protein kinase [Roseiflexaceae bacterium]|nr:protein kinase [Roseiflexaceae bacterium]
MDEPISFGYWVRRRRKALDLTSEELAQQVGCAGVTIRKIEADARRPSRQIAERLAECLQLPSDDRAAFMRAARAELAVDRLPTPPEPPTTLLSPRRPDDRAPRTPALKGYQLRESIGAGGFGAVYRAVQPGVGRDVAVKFIRPEYASQPDFIRRFEAEAQIVARLEHPQIVPLYDYWRDPSGAYLVMRYVRGGNLQAALESGPWPVERTTRLLEQIGAALAFAHRHRVVHRDLKPANILLDGDGNAYLADFGIAKDMGMANALGETQPGALIGSPAYLSPEQLRDEPITLRSDIYSLGVLLYEALTGAHPFGNLPPAERLYQQLHGHLPSLRASCPDLSPKLDVVIQRATAKAPAERYPDVAAMLAEWQQAVTTTDDRRPTDDQRPTTDDRPTATASRIDDQSSSFVLRPSSDQDTVLDLAAIENPYKGLRAFGEADAADFFGREALTQRLLERLADDGETSDAWRVAHDEGSTRHPTPVTRHPARFIAVVGPSGSGKSSVVRAGLIPALRRGGVDGSERWFVVELFPGAHPLEELEAALLRVAANPPESLLGQLREDARGLARAIKRVLPDDAETELVLVIDQFEELWTLTLEERARAHFLASLVAALDDPRSRVRLIVTLRADFIDRPLQHGTFGALLREHTEFVLPLTPEELERAIVGPAQRVGLVLEPELVATIVVDVGAQPGALPLLQYALTELFERRAGRTLTLADYRASGGIRAALARRADAIYASLDSQAQVATRQLFLRLITLGEGVEDTRRRAPRAELSGLTSDQPKNQEPRAKNQSDEIGSQFSLLGSQPAIDSVVDAYGRARLLSFDRDPITREPTVEVAHEALLRSWNRLREWLDTSRADIRTQRALAAAAAEWRAAERDPSYLLTGARLAQFESWAAQTELTLTSEERTFLDASLAERERQVTAERERQQHELKIAQQLAATEQRRAAEQHQAAARLRRRAFLLAGALAVALIAAITAGFFARNAQDNFVRSERLRLAGEATSALARGASGELPALLALRSLHENTNPQAIDALRRALERPFSLRRLSGHTDALYAVAFSPDGKQALTAGADETVQVWDVASGQELRQCKCYPDSVISVTFSPDGRQALTGSDYGIVRLWDTTTGQELRRFEGHFGAVSSVQFSPDGKQILTGSKDNTARLWDLATGRELRQFRGHDDAVWAVASSPDGRLVLTASANRIVLLWDAQTGQQLRRFEGHIDGIHSLAFSPDGAHAVSASDDRTARLWNVQNGQELRRFVGHTDAVLRVAFSPDGQYLLTSSADHTARLWDVASGRQLRAFVGHTNAVQTAAFSPDGQQILTGSADNTALLWNTLATTEPRTFISHTGAVNTVAFSRDGRYVLTGSDDRTARLWNAQTGQQIRQFEGHTNIVYSVSFSPDGTQAATASEDGTAQLWSVQSGKLLRMFSYGIAVFVAIFSPDGRDLLTGSTSVYRADLATGQEVRLLDMPDMERMVLSPDGRYLLIASRDHVARLWDLASHQEVRSFSGHTGCICGVAFSPDDRFVLTGSYDTTARLWDAQTGQQLRIFNGHTAEITAVAFSPDRRLVLTGSADGTARLWDATTGEQLDIFRSPTGAIIDVAFSPDGKQVLIGGDDGIARLWHPDIQELIRIACASLPRDFTPEERAQYDIPDDGPTCPKA